MKKIFFTFTIVLLISTGFSSCKKDWSCSCTDQSGNSTSTAINNETIIDARSKCKDMSYTVGPLSESCGLQ
jgi:hypothetical protein